MDALWEATYQFPQLHRFQRLPDRLFTDRATQRDVRQHRLRHYHRILLHHSNALAQGAM
ncbi:hypothetical protein D3C71_2128850 [compost metagenome]